MKNVLLMLALSGGAAMPALPADLAKQPAESGDLVAVRERLLAPLRRAPEADQVRQLLGAQRPDGSWPSVDYQSTHRSAWRTSRHLSYVMQLARAYTAPDSPLRQNAELKRATSSGLDYWLTHDFRNSNWWHNRIGVPGSMSRILLLWDAELTDAQRKKGIEILSRADLSMTGQNLVWLADIVAARGILQRDVGLVAAAYRRISDEIRVTGEEGIQADFSFHQHGPCLYSHGYGAGFATDCSETAVLLDGTQFAFPSEKIDLLSRLILDGHQWLARGSTPDLGAIGRQTARSNQSVEYLGSVARNMLKLPTDREREFESLARRSEGHPATPLVGNRHFWRSDIMVHHREGFYASARMFSKRNVNTDGPANGEGIRNHHIADGCNLLLRTGREYWDISPVWDWEKIPGTTVEQTGDFRGSPRRKGETDFVGGVSDGTYGMAAFDLRRDTLSGRKAWFFFDREYACLGCGIRCDTANPVITTVNQCLREGDTTVSDNGTLRALPRGMNVLRGPAWVQHDQVAYFFPQPTPLRVSLDRQSGSWHLIATERPNAPVERDVFALWIEHGRSPAGAAYAYVVAPGMASSEFSPSTDYLAVEILRNDPELQAVRHRSLRISCAAFYEPGRLKLTDDTSLSVDRPCLVLMREAKGEFTASVSNPKNEPLSVSVVITMPNRTAGRTFELPGGMDAGKSVTHEIPLEQSTKR